MSKLKLAFFTLFFCSAAFAEPVLYVCERPAWEGVESCGPNNTYMTYSMFVDTDDFDKRKPVYDLKMHKGCDLSEADMWNYNYKVNEKTISFLVDPAPRIAVNYQMLSTIILDRETLKAVMTNVEFGKELTCREEPGEDRRPGTSPSRKGIRLQTR
ncbi:MAG: hypothetical protein OEU84_12880 [Xanthomonadales bacterium]|nr:hypothetical protein [Xanthomonadales bacterium]